jgi:hypothetical protein
MPPSKTVRARTARSRRLRELTALVLVALFGFTLFAFVDYLRNVSGAVNLPDRANDTAREKVESVGRVEKETGYVLVKTSNPGLLQQLAEEEGLAEEGTSGELSKLGIRRFKIKDLERATTEEVADRLNGKLKKAKPQAGPLEEFAEPDAVYEPALVPNDPWYSTAQWAPKRIKAPEAWDTTTGSPDTIIAILDTGVNSLHEDLVGNITPGWNMYDNNAETTDVNGHGTLVAGSAAARGNNGIGVAAPCWYCRIMPIRVSGLDGYATASKIASGMVWAADRGARVANASYAVSASSSVSSAGQYLMDRGGIATIAAGNQGTRSTSPDNPYVVTTGATDYYDVLYSWSNYGLNIDLASPGYAYTTSRAGGYSNAAGTSIAAPVVAGVAGLVISANPSLTGMQVRDILYTSADDLDLAGWDEKYGYGRVNAAKAVAMAKSGVIPPLPPRVAPAPSPSPTPTASATPTPTASPSPTPAASPTATPSPTPTPAPSPTPTPAPSLSFTVAPYVMSKTATSVTLTWTTNSPSTGSVQYGTKGKLNLTAASSTLASTHTLTLSNLTPNTSYNFQVSATAGSANATYASSFKTLKR